MKVSAFQSIDGTIHLNEKVCAERDYAIEIRGVVQSANPSLRTDNVSIKDVCTSFVVNREKVAEIVRRYGRKLHGIESRKPTK